MTPRDHIAALRCAFAPLDARLRDALAAVLPAADDDGTGYRERARLHAELADAPSPPSGEGADRVARVRLAFGLDQFALDLLLIAVSAEVDRRYARAYACLQADPALLRPGLDLAFDLLCDTSDERLRHLGAVAATAPLLRHGLLRLETDPRAILPARLSSLMVPHEAVTTFLVGATTMPPQPTQADQPALAPETFAALQGVARQGGAPIRCHIHALDDQAAQGAATHLAAILGKPLLSAALPDADPETVRALAARVLMEAVLHDAVACLAVPERLAAHDRHDILRRAADAACDVVLLMPHDDWPAQMVPFDVVRLAPMDLPARLACWQRELAAAGLSPDAGETAVLASRFRCGHSAIHAAVQQALRQPDVATFPALLHAIKSGRREGLAGFAHRVEGAQDWNDLILPPARMRQLHELCAQVEHRHRVDQDWGFADKLALGRGISALFSGPSGTGKTMAAGIVARSLHLDLYRVDLAQIVSKYIGETEKNLDRIFRAAESADAVLFFDEADALFGKRSEVKDAHDRYANLEVGYLLQKMEEYDGLAILATNLRQHIDDAFTRRLRCIVEFPSPDEDDRLRIWRSVFPHQAPLAEDVDFPALARTVRLAGGNIRNIALSAAFLAAAEGTPIAQAHLLRAAESEYLKVGRTWG